MTITSGAVRRRSRASSSRSPASATRAMPGSERSSVAIARRPAPGHVGEQHAHVGLGHGPSLNGG